MAVTIEPTSPTSVLNAKVEGAEKARQMPFLAQVSSLAWRTLVVNLRVPAAIIPSLAISLFSLFVYNAQFSGVASSFLTGQSYIGFILPLALISGALSGATVAAGTIVNDIERGYFDKLSLTPVSRWALLLGPMVAGGIILSVQALLITFVGLLLGLQPVTGIAGLAAVIGFALLLGVGFSGLTVMIALVTGNNAATAGTSFLFFPLTFLTSTFVPVDQLTGWIKVAAQVNPVTYALEAMRAILNTGWDQTLIFKGLLAGALMFVVLFALALYGLQVRTRRR